MNLIHFSAKEYLTASQNKLQGFATNNDPHEMIAHMCLRSLSGVDLLRSLGIHSDSLMPQVSKAHSSSALSYAVSFWKLHYRLAEPHSKRLPGFLHNCLRGAFEENFEACKAYVSVSPTPHVRLGNLESRDLVDADTSATLDSYVIDAALVIATIFGFDRIARLELQMGAHTYLTHGAGKYTALHLAAKNGHLGVVEALILHGANVNSLTAEGYTPLYYAAISGRHDILKVLIEHGAGIDSSRFYNRTSSLSHRTEQNAFQNYVLESAISESCGDCGEMRANYTVCA